MLRDYRKEYSGNNLQFVIIDQAGIILKSEQSIFKIKVGDPISSVHPFFESISSISIFPEEGVIFNCVHLHFAGQNIIADIELFKKKEGILIVIKDLTQHYNAYQIAAQARNEAIISEELVVLKNIELEERERFKNKFIQNFSHEIRNPLTCIVAITNVLGDTALTQEQKQMLDFLEDSNTHLNLMLEDILSISMIASGKLLLRENVFKLTKLLALLEFTYKAKAKLKGLNFTLKIDEKIPEFVEGDRLRLFQVVTNLLENAIKYTQKGGVALSVQCNQTRANRVSLHFSIEDTGVGIPTENIEKVFESFSQLYVQKKGKGVGLGLPIVEGLLELMGSEIKVKSIEDKGSIFYFDIILKYPLRPRSTRPLALKGNKENALKSKSGHRYKLLMVEDDERVQTALFKSLMDTGQFYVDLLDDGAKVIEDIINNKYDIVIMDVDLPNVSGDSLTKLIREFPFKDIRNIPIIGLTANAFKHNIEDYLQAGMNKVLSKPVERDALLKSIFSFLK